MFEFLKSKNKYFVGIDFGTSAIKVVELSYKDQKACLENYGIVDLGFTDSDQSGNASPSPYEQKLNDSFKSLISRMKIKRNSSAYVSIPGFNGLVTIIDLPEMQHDELAKAIQFEAHKYIPSSLDEVAMSWEVIDQGEAGRNLVNVNEKAPKRIKVLLVAAPKKDIEHYDRLVSGSNLEVSAIELETFSIVRSLVGDDTGNFFIIDIGSRATNMILVEKGTVKINRNIDVGGSEITATISDGMSISRQRAEVFKSGEKDFLNSRETALIIPVLELIAGESKRILASYREQNKDSRIDGIFLSGGSSKMKGLEEYFTRSLGTKVTVGNPWRRIAFDNELAPLTKKLGASFAVSIGLALRGIEEYKRK